MPGKGPNASPNSVYSTFDSHSILAQFDLSQSSGPFVHRTDSPQEQQESGTLQPTAIASPEVPGNELGIYEAPTTSEDDLSPLEAFSETAQPLATRVPEDPLYQEPPGHIRSPILSK